MNSFSLSASPKKVLPETVEVDGDTFLINADFRVILNCFKLQTDAGIREADRNGILCRLFYVDRAPPDPWRGFAGFVRTEAPDADEPPGLQQFCFEFDADVIYASFLQDYGINLLKIEFLHWYEFRILLQSLGGESPFNNRIRLRFLDLKIYKGEEYTKMARAKAAVQLPVVLTAEEIEKQEEFQREWGE